MSFIDAIKTCFRKYATFSGRARRSEFWYWQLFTAIVGGIAAAIDGSDSNVVAGIVAAEFFIPNLAVAVRRLHDTGKSGWYYLMVLIPLVGWVFPLIKYCTDSEPGTNMYGENPKGQSGFEAYAQPYAAPEEPQYQRQAQEAVYSEVKTEPVSDSKANVTGFCPYCDTPLLVGQKFCTGCGHRIDV